MNMYELTGEALQLQELLVSGEIDEQVVSDTLEALGADEKIESVCYVIRNLDAFAKACKEEEDKIAEKRKSAENGVKRLKDNLLTFLSASMLDKVKAGLFTVRLETSTSVAVDEEIIGEEYKIPQPPKIDKAKIREDLKAGKPVEGAHFAESKYVVIR